MPAPKTIAELSLVLNLTEDKTKSVLFNVVDFLLANPLSDDAIESAMHEMPAYVGDQSFEKAFGEALWATYEVAIGRTPAKKLWINLTEEGLKTTVGRPY